MIYILFVIVRIDVVIVVVYSCGWKYLPLSIAIKMKRDRVKTLLKYLYYIENYRSCDAFILVRCFQR